MRTVILLLSLALIAKVQAQSFEERGPNYHSVSHTVQDGRGGEISTPPIVAIETGMNYWNDEKKQWLATEARFEATEDAFVVRRHQAKIHLSAELNEIGSVRLALADGTRLSSTPVGIALFDAANGDFLVIAGLTNSVGVQISDDQVLYTDAFKGAGISASVLYTVEKGTFSQDVIFTCHLNPEEWGFPKESTRIQILTEFYGAPEPERVRRPVYVEADEKVRASMVTPDLMDEMLGFSDFVLGSGYAFTIPTDLAPEGNGAAVCKEYITMMGRTFLSEVVPYTWLEKGFSALPSCEDTFKSGSLSPRTGVGKGYAALPVPPSTAQKTKPAQMAKLVTKPRGVVIDYIGNIGGTLSGTTVFSSYTNYFVSGAVYCNGAVVIEGGSIFKYPTSNTNFLQFNNSVTCKTSSARMAVFTAVDDDSVGDVCNVTNSGYTGIINTNGYADPAVKMGQTSLTLSNVRFCYAKRAIQYNSSQAIVTVNVNHSQFVKCIRGIDLTWNGCGSAGSGTLTVNLNNSLMTGVTYPVSLSGIASPINLGLVQSTVDGSTKLVSGTWTGALTVRSTNSIYANIANSSSGTYQGYANGFYNVAQAFGAAQFLPSASPFQSIGAGNYYLTDASGLRNQGTNVLAAWLSTDIKKRTTYPPLVVDRVPYTNSQTLWPQAQRDTDALDLGFHYQPLDYALSGVEVTNYSTLTLTNGVAIGLFGTANANYGLAVSQGGQLFSEGRPESPNWLMQYNTVQEQPVSAWTRTASGLLVSEFRNQTPASVINCRFTQFSVLSLDAPAFYAPTNTGPFYFRDCEFHGGKVVSVRPSLVFTNCLFERVYGEVKPKDGLTNSWRNNLFVGGALTTGATNQFLRDNVFDQTWVTNWNSYSGGTNAYVTNYQRLNPSLAGDIVLTNSPGYQAGPLGLYYQPTNSVLINADTTTWATNVGMYHYTLSTNTVSGLQVKEAGTRLDVGYHYIALGTNNLAADSDGDGFSDYQEDVNGNGSFDAGEMNWQGYNSLNGLVSGSGLQVFTPLKP